MSKVLFEKYYYDDVDYVLFDMPDAAIEEFIKITELPRPLVVGDAKYRTKITNYLHFIKQYKVKTHTKDYYSRLFKESLKKWESVIERTTHIQITGMFDVASATITNRDEEGFVKYHLMRDKLYAKRNKLIEEFIEKYGKRKS